MSGTAELINDATEISDVRLKIFAAAWDLVSEVGIEDGTSTLSLDDVVGRAGVPRSTAYRHFTVDGRTPREEFRRCFGEWVRYELQDELYSTDPETIAVAVRHLSAPVPDSAEQRRSHLIAALSEIMAVNQHSLERNRVIAASLALRAASWSRAAATNEVDSWTPVIRPDNQAYQSLTQEFIDHYRARLRPGLTVELLGELLASWTTGVVLNMGLDRSVHMQPRSADKPVDLGLSGVGLVALIEAFVDFDD